jgi:hypothetical protein
MFGTPVPLPSPERVAPNGSGLWPAQMTGSGAG